MITRRALLGGAGAAVLTVPSSAWAQRQGTAPPLVGTLTAGNPASAPTGQSPSDQAFLEGMRGLGYREGQTVRVEARYHRGRPERCPALAAELVALKPAVIFGTSLYGISALKTATSTIPIVGLDLESDPVAAGFVSSLARPGGNITGIFLDLPEMSGKLLQFLKESLPRLARIGVLWDANIAKLQFQAVEGVAPTAGLRIHSLPIRKLEDIAPAVAEAARERVGAVVVLSSPFTSVSRVQLAERLLKQRLPSISLFTTFAEAGGLLAYGPNFPGMWRQSAGFVDRVLKGARPAEMPVERPVKFELLVNLKTAKALKLTIPPLVLGRADRTLE